MVYLHWLKSLLKSLSSNQISYPFKTWIMISLFLGFLILLFYVIYSHESKLGLFVSFVIKHILNRGLLLTGHTYSVLHSHII